MLIICLETTESKSSLRTRKPMLHAQNVSSLYCVWKDGKCKKIKLQNLHIDALTKIVTGNYVYYTSFITLILIIIILVYLRK